MDTNAISSAVFLPTSLHGTVGNEVVMLTMPELCPAAALVHFTLGIGKARTVYLSAGVTRTLTGGAVSFFFSMVLHKIAYSWTIGLFFFFFVC